MIAFGLNQWNFVLNLADVLAFVLLGVSLGIIMHRQRKELSDAAQTLATVTTTLSTVTETVKTLAAYAVQHDEDSLKWRRAIKNLGVALNIHSVVQALDEPLQPDTASHEERETFVDGLLVERLSATRSSNIAAASDGESPESAEPTPRSGAEWKDRPAERTG